MKTVIVTGASRGIGAAICRNLRTKGVRVIGVARSSAPLKELAMEKIGTGPMEYVVGDVCDPQTVESAVKLAASKGTLDAIILNAGIIAPVTKVATTDVKEMKNAFDVNYFSNLYWIQASLPLLRASKGRILYTTSGVASLGFGGFASYSGSKAAMNSTILVLSEEEPGVISIAVNPGVTETEMFKEFAKLGRETMTEKQSAGVAQIKEGKKYNDPKDVAESFARLALAVPKGKTGSNIVWDEPWIKSLQI